MQMKNKNNLPCEGARYFNIGEIDPPGEAHRSQIDMSKLEELTKSIKELGVIQPIILFKKSGRFEIVAGHRRFLASVAAGLAQIPAVLLADETQVEIVKYQENAFREDLSALDDARVIKKLKDSGRYETNKSIAEALNRSEGYISQRLAIFTWPNPIVLALQEKLINFSVARELSHIDDSEALNLYLHHAIHSGCTPDVARSWRTQFEQTKQAQNTGRIIDESIEKNIIPRPMIVCEGCRCVLDSPSELLSIWVCRSCKNEILQAFQTPAD